MAETIWIEFCRSCPWRQPRKSTGYLTAGRCPSCGDMTWIEPKRFSDSSDPIPATPCAFCGVVIPAGGFARREGRPACVECWCADEEPGREHPCYHCGKEMTKEERYRGDFCAACEPMEAP